MSLSLRRGERVPKAGEGILHALKKPLIRPTATFSPRRGEKDTDLGGGGECGGSAGTGRMWRKRRHGNLTEFAETREQRRRSAANKKATRGGRLSCQLQSPSSRLDRSAGFAAQDETCINVPYCVAASFVQY